MTAVCKAAVKGKLSIPLARNRSMLFFIYYIARGIQQFFPSFVSCVDESASCRVDVAIIQRRLPVLLKYLNSDTERQLQALYALQALIVTLDQPPSK